MEKVEITMEEYKTLLGKSIAFNILRKAMGGSVRKYVSGNGLYLDSNLLEVFALLLSAWHSS